MTGISVVLGDIPQDLALANEYVRTFIEDEYCDDVIVAVTNQDLDSEDSQLKTLREELPFARLVPVTRSNELAPRLNQLVANANNSLVLVVPGLIGMESGTLARFVEEFLSYSDPELTQVLPLTEFGVGNKSSFSDVMIQVAPAAEQLGLTLETVNQPFMCGRTNYLDCRGLDEEGPQRVDVTKQFISRQRRIGRQVRFARRSSALCQHGNSYGVYQVDKAKVEDGTNQSAGSTVYPNLETWTVEPSLRAPLVTVAIATKDRSELLRESIESVLFQSFQDFEIIVVDDGSGISDASQEVVKSLADSRVKLIRLEESRGVAAARNIAADASKCPLTAVHDDDDIMLPDRLLLGIQGIKGGVDASYGGWVNFNHDSGALTPFPTRRGFGTELNAFNGMAPGHSTWTVPTNVIKSLRYDESLTSSVDHNLATRMDRAGVRWAHIGEFLYLRRVHSQQITANDAGRQKSAHHLTRLANTFLFDRARESEVAEIGEKLGYLAMAKGAALDEVVKPYLPDHLVHRELRIRHDVANSLMAIDAPHKYQVLVEERDLRTGRLKFSEANVDGANFADIVRARKAGLTGWSIIATRKSQGAARVKVDESLDMVAADQSEEKVNEWFRRRLDAHWKTLKKKHPEAVYLVQNTTLSRQATKSFADLPEAIDSRAVVVAGEFGFEKSALFYGFESLNIALESLARHVKISSTETAFEVYPQVSMDEVSAKSPVKSVTN